MKNIVLASKSPRRADILKHLGVPFEIYKRDVHEDSPLSDPFELVKTLAYEKASSAADHIAGDSLVIGADTIVFHNDNILGKPRDEADAFYMLQGLNNQTHDVITGICVFDTSCMDYGLDVVKTRVTMGNFSESMFKAYVSTGEPLDKAGGYGIQGLGALLVKEISGCYYNVVGLPVHRCMDLLEKFGYDFFDSRRK